MNSDQRQICPKTKKTCLNCKWHEKRDEEIVHWCEAHLSTIIQFGIDNEVVCSDWKAV